MLAVKRVTKRGPTSPRSHLTGLPRASSASNTGAGSVFREGFRVYKGGGRTSPRSHLTGLPRASSASNTGAGSVFREGFGVWGSGGDPPRRARTSPGCRARAARRTRAPAASSGRAGCAAPARRHQYQSPSALRASESRCWKRLMQAAVRQQGPHALQW